MEPGVWSVIDVEREIAVDCEIDVEWSGVWSGVC